LAVTKGPESRWRSKPTSLGATLRANFGEVVGNLGAVFVEHVGDRNQAAAVARAARSESIGPKLPRHSPHPMSAFDVRVQG
jgi:hypothetical protein